MLDARAVAAATEAFQRTMAQGDRELANDVVELKILQAIVASAATDVVRWLNTRVVGGQDLSKPLEGLASALDHENYVGKTLATVESKAKAGAWTAFKEIVTTGSLPVGLASFVALIVGVFGLAFQGGVAFGNFLLFAVTGGR